MKYLPLALLLCILTGCEEEGCTITTPTTVYRNVTILREHTRMNAVEIQTEDGRYIDIHGSFTIERPNDSPKQIR